MTIDEILAEVIALLQRDGRLSCRLLKRRFLLDDEYLVVWLPFPSKDSTRSMIEHASR